MSIEDLFDDIGGPLDYLDKLESWLTFAFSPVSKRAKHGRLNLVQYSIPRADKMMERGLPAVSLNETMAYLQRFGVIVKCNGFDSERMHFQIRRNQAKWVDTLLDVDANGIPRLDYGRKSWEEKAAALKAEKRAKKRGQSASWLEKLLG